MLESLKCDRMSIFYGECVGQMDLAAVPRHQNRGRGER